MNSAASSAPPTTRSPPGEAARRSTSDTTTERARVVFHARASGSKDREYTILGISRQMRANSTTVGVAAGSRSADGQNPAISSQVTRPSRKAPAAESHSFR